MDGVRFYGKQWKGQDGKHSDEYGLILAHKDISEPVPQTNFITVPARNGFIDATNNLGVVKFQPRTITMRFLSMEKFENWTSKASELQNDLSGIEVGICFDDDDYWVWKGRVTTIKQTSVKNTLFLEVKATVEPYKQAFQSADEEWLWDPFDFESGVINEFYEIEINESKEITLEGIGKPCYPIIYVHEMTESMVAFGLGERRGSHILQVGENRCPEIILTADENKISITGRGVVSIDFTAGRL